MNLFLLMFSLFSLHSRCLKIPVEFSDETGVPVIYAEIEKKIYPLILDLGSFCEFSLTKNAMDQVISKELIGTHSTMGINGEITENSKYLIQKMKISNGIILHPTIELENEDIATAGTVGRGLFQTRNWVLDFPHKSLILFKNQKEIQREGYRIEEFIEVPIEINRWGVVFRAEIHGVLNSFFINTRSAHSACRTGPLNARFKVEKNDFGSVSFDSIDMDSSIQDVDGYLGLDFMKDKTIVIDFQAKRAWIRK